MFRTFIGMKFSIFEGVRKFFMQFVEKDKLFSLEAYLAFEEASETRHELYQGNLIEMSGTTTIHNEIVGNIYMILRNFLKGTDWKVYSENIKIGIGENTFFYPDVIVSKPFENQYISRIPVLVVEVLSKSTRQFDLTDKFIQYRKIETLHYYLCVEPEQQVVIFFFKNENGEWLSETYTKDEDKIDLKLLNISFTLKDIYKPE